MLGHGRPRHCESVGKLPRRPFAFKGELQNGAARWMGDRREL
jgi:hypothetical protein